MKFHDLHKTRTAGPAKNPASLDSCDYPGPYQGVILQSESLSRKVLKEIPGWEIGPGERIGFRAGRCYCFQLFATP
jgi:hypothetical protein